MIFARYKGRGQDFTTGKVYLATPEMNESSTVNFGFLLIDSDPGPAIRVSPEDESFEYLEEVYAVVLKPVSEMEPGEVTVLDSATNDGLANIQGIGLFLMSNFIILDRTNIFPGLVVMDTDGTWKPVRRVNERLGMMIEGSTRYRDPTEFRFAASGDDLLTEPVVKCVMADGFQDLTAGKFYRLVQTKAKEETVTVHDDSGKVREFMADRFEMNIS
jgi:hypothetical protein